MSPLPKHINNYVLAHLTPGAPEAAQGPQGPLRLQRSPPQGLSRDPCGQKGPFGASTGEIGGPWGAPKPLSRHLGSPALMGAPGRGPPKASAAKRDSWQGPPGLPFKVPLGGPHTSGSPLGAPLSPQRGPRGAPEGPLRGHTVEGGPLRGPPSTVSRGAP